MPPGTLQPVFAISINVAKPVGYAESITAFSTETPPEVASQNVRQGVEVANNMKHMIINLAKSQAPGSLREGRRAAQWIDRADNGIL
jgi:hypothetical protein